MREDERILDVAGEPAAAEVAPVRRRPRWSSGLVAGAILALAAFLAGLAVAADPPGPSETSPGRPTPGPSVAQEAAAPSAAAGTPTLAPRAPVAPATPGPQPGSSAFLAGFDPASIIAALPGAERCTTGEARAKEVPRTRRDGPRMTVQRSWLAWCPIPADARQAFLLDLFDALTDRTPAPTFGFSATLAGTGDALLPYAEPPLAGTVSVTADAAGRGLAIAIVAMEWRVDAAP